MNLNDNFFKKVENKTKVSKETILSLASKLQDENMKDEKVLRDVVKEISTITGKSIPKEKEDKIVKVILEDKVPKDITNMVD